jgi:hypothetical protein
MGPQRDRSYKYPGWSVLGVEAGEEDAGEAPVFGDCPKIGAATVNNMRTKNMRTKNRIEV